MNLQDYICPLCGQFILSDEEQSVEVSMGRFTHSECLENATASVEDIVSETIMPTALRTSIETLCEQNLVGGVYEVDRQN